MQYKTRKNAIVEYHDYQIPFTQLKGPKGDGDMQAEYSYVSVANFLYPCRGFIDFSQKFATQ